MGCVCVCVRDLLETCCSIFDSIVNSAGMGGKTVLSSINMEAMNNNSPVAIGEDKNNISIRNYTYRRNKYEGQRVDHGHLSKLGEAFWRSGNWWQFVEMSRLII